MMSEIIRPMFTALPLPKGVASDALLAGYLVALEGMYPSTLKSVVVKLVKGIWGEEVKFCPRPPELANMVRDEQRRLDVLNRPRLAAPVLAQPFKDIRVTQRNRVQELAKQGYVLVATGISQETCLSLAKSRALPAKSIHLWAIDEVWAPQAAAHLVEVHRVEAKKRTEVAAPEAMTAEDAAYWQMISDLKDAKEVTPDQMAFRRQIGREIDAQQVEHQRAAE